MFGKYEFVVTDKIEINGKILTRIKATKDFARIKAGTIGGYIESEKNLSQQGNCWIAGNAKVFDDAIVFEDAFIFGNAQISENAKVSGSVHLGDHWYDAKQIVIRGDTHIFE